MAFEVFDDIAFYWFGLSVLGAIMGPWTLVKLLSALKLLCRSRSDRGASNRHPRFRLVVEEEGVLKALPSPVNRADKTTTLEVKKRKGSCIPSFLTTLFILGWLLLAFMAYQVALHQQEELASFNPYDVLQLQEGATAKDVKRAFRRLSLQYHPDKNPGNSEAERMFILITKAHLTLTDDAARENYEKYGNPDGYTGTSVTIGLPSFLTSSSNEMAILLAYFAVFILTLPLVVGVWWSHSSKFDKSGVKMDTLMGFYSLLNNDGFAPKFLIEILSTAQEFKQVGQRSNLADLKKVYNLIKDEMAKPRIRSRNELHADQIAYVATVNMILHAYLLRVDMPQSLNDEVVYVLGYAHTLLGMMTEVAIQKQHYRSIEPIIRVSQCLTQQLWVHGSELMQLPGFTEREVKQCARRSVKTLARFLELTREERESMLMPCNLSDDQLGKVETACKAFPRIRLSAKCLVEGKDTIHRGDIATLRFHLVRVNDFADGVVPSIDERTVDGEGEDPYDLPVFEEPEEKPPKDPIEAHAPLFPYNKQESWMLILLKNDEKYPLINMQKVPVISGSDYVEIKHPTFALKPGTHTLDVQLMCDSYVGLDVSCKLQITVLPPERELGQDLLEGEVNEEKSEEPEKEPEAKWYFLGGATWWEGLIHAILIYVILLLGFDILESRGYISWNPLKSPEPDPRIARERERRERMEEQEFHPPPDPTEKEPAAIGAQSSSTMDEL